LDNKLVDLGEKIDKIKSMIENYEFEDYKNSQKENKNSEEWIQKCTNKTRE